MKKLLFILAIISITSCTLLVLLLHNGTIRFNYPDREEFPFLGIDISHHQGDIRWNELRTEGISFVIIKATEGEDFKDTRFKTNWKKSKEEGYRTGAYHFYRFCKSGKEQALNFIETVPNQPDNLPPAIDLEFGGNCKTDKSKNQIVTEIQEYIQMVEDHYRKRVIIYATGDFYDEFLMHQFVQNPVWIRDVYRRPVLNDQRSWAIWQFANRAHLSGIDGYVDLNVLNGRFFSFFELERY